MSEEIKNNEAPEISKSKAKREAKKAEAKKMKNKKAMENVIEWIVGIAIAGVFIAAIAGGIYQQATKVTPNNNFSEMVTEAGFYKGEDLGAVKDIGLDSLVAPLAEVAPSDEDVQKDIDSMLSGNQELKEDTALAAKDGDKVNIDYVGSIDGVEFEGGNSNGAGYDLTLGSGSFIDGFEDQLIGTHPGDEVTVEVTFPEDYNKEELQGKDAVFAVSVHGIYVTPEFNDAFVAAHYSDRASSAEELRQSIYDEKYDANLESYITKYVSENASVSKYPKGLLKNTASVIYYSDQQAYEYANSYYSYYMGYSPYSQFSDYTGMSDAAYQADLKDRAKKNVATTMTYESVFVKNNLEVTDEIYNEVLADVGEGGEETYGKAYISQLAIAKAAVKHLKNTVKVQ